jgi:putative acetyltransferase
MQIFEGIRKGTPADYQDIIDLWQRSVEATHNFLTPIDIQNIKEELLGKYLPAVEIRLEQKERLHGFIGLNGTHVEMLFVDPVMRGTGIGSRLLNHARRLFGTLTVAVNEQNQQAYGFYVRYGFVKTGRSAVDSSGRPFPLIHMKFDSASGEKASKI